MSWLSSDASYHIGTTYSHRIWPSQFKYDTQSYTKELVSVSLLEPYVNCNALVLFQTNSFIMRKYFQAHPPKVPATIIPCQSGVVLIGQGDPSAKNFFTYKYIYYLNILWIQKNPCCRIIFYECFVVHSTFKNCVF